MIYENKCINIIYIYINMVEFHLWFSFGVLENVFACFDVIKLKSSEKSHDLSEKKSDQNHLLNAEYPWN